MNIGKSIKEIIIAHPSGYANMNITLSKITNHELIIKTENLTWDKVFQTISFVYSNIFIIFA